MKNFKRLTIIFFLMTIIGITLQSSYANKIEFSDAIVKENWRSFDYMDEEWAYLGTFERTERKIFSSDVTYKTHFYENLYCDVDIYLFQLSPWVEYRKKDASLTISSSVTGTLEETRSTTVSRKMGFNIIPEILNYEKEMSYAYSTSKSIAVASNISFGLNEQSKDDDYAIFYLQKGKIRESSSYKKKGNESSELIGHSRYLYFYDSLESKVVLRNRSEIS